MPTCRIGNNFLIAMFCKAKKNYGTSNEKRDEALVADFHRGGGSQPDQNRRRMGASGAPPEESYTLGQRSSLRFRLRELLSGVLCVA